MGPRVEFLIRRLRAEGDALLTQLHALAVEAWATPVYAGATTWTIHSVLAHLVSAEHYLQLMIADIAAGGPGAPADVDVDAINAAEVATLTRLSPAELIERLAMARERTVVLVSTFDEDTLDRRGRHPVLGEITLDDFVKLIYRHAKMHMRDVQHAQNSNLMRTG